MNPPQLLRGAPTEAPGAAAATVRELEPIAEAPARRDTLQRDARSRRLLVAADAIACAVGLIVVVALSPRTQLTAQSVLLIALAPATAKLLGLYDREPARLRKSTLDELPALIQLAASLAFLTWILSPVLLDGVLRPKNATVLLLVLIAGLAFYRALGRRLAGAITDAERCLFIGPAEEAMRFRRKLEEDQGANARVVAQIDLLDASPWASPNVSERALADARQLARKLEIQRVIIAPQSPTGGDMLDLMRTFGAIGVRVSVIPALLQVVGSAVEFEDVHGVALLGIRSFSLPRSSRVIKRAFDIAGGVIALAIFSPLMGLIALAVKLTSSGPVCFRQERVGLDGRRFELLKFRSMVVDAEKRKSELMHHNQAAEGFFKIADDPRITPIGRLLRATNLDELPQLFNVVRGEMSLVGPRPLIPEEDERVVGWHRRRLELTPGMTGHWQVLGSSRVPLDEMVAIDYLYVANWSLWADLKLLLRTVPHVLGRRGL